MALFRLILNGRELTFGPATSLGSRLGMRVATTVALVLTLTAPAVLPEVQRTVGFTPADMLAIQEFARGAEPVLSPDGKVAAYAIVDSTDEANIRAFRPTAFLHVVDVAGSQHRRLTIENTWGDTPVWSPDGRFLAFIHKTGSPAGHRIALWHRESGRTHVSEVSLPAERQALPSGALAPQWTPDSRRLIVPVAEPEAAAAEKPRVRVLKSTDPIVPGDARFTDARLSRLVAFEPSTGTVRTVTPEPVALRGFQLSPDGRHLLFRAVTPETLGRFRKEEIRTFVAPVSGDHQPRVVLADRKPSWIAFSPDGAHLLFAENQVLRRISLTGGDEQSLVGDLPSGTRNPRVTAAGWVAVLAPRPRTGPTDPKMYSIVRPVDDVLVIDVRSRKVLTLTRAEREDEIDQLTWSADGSALVYRTTDPTTYRESLVRWRVGRTHPESLISVDEALSGVSVSSDGNTIAFVAMSATHPADGFVLAAGQRRGLTELNAQVGQFRFVAPEMVDFHSADGKPLRALLFRPEGASAARPVPVVTYVYEKLTPQKNHFNPEAQLHVAHGYAYLMPDVLITPGYTGESFVKSVVPAVNAVRTMGFTTGRFGITGGSFGGYAGLFLISRVDIFSAAVLRAPPSEFFSTWGSGRDRDIWTIETGQARTGGTPWEVPERYLANSPFFHADRVNTPVLILHGEKDFTVPFQQGELMFHALRALGRTAEFAMYREGDHSIVRGSRDDFLDVYRRMLEWWDRYLREF